MRPFFTILSLLLVSAVGLVLAEEPKAKPRDKADKKASAWDVDEFLKTYDKDKDGSLSRAELPERYRHNFDRIDANNDGKLSRDELRKGAGYLHARRRPSDVVFHLVEMSDTDESCTAELQRIYDFLRKLDTDKDGKIHASELDAARKALVQSRVDRILEELDADKDGKISRAEARGQIEKYFADLDTNKDGFIDRAELLRGATDKPKEVSPRKEGSSKKASGSPGDE